MKTNRIFSIILVFCLLLGLCPFQAAAAGGSCGDNLTWSLSEDGVLTISGTGDMYDYDAYAGTYAPWDGTIRSVVVEEGVTSIGDFAFAYEDLAQIQLPDTLKRIGKYAFVQSELARITIPESVTEIGECAFERTKLTEIRFPDSITAIPEGVCYDIPALKRVKLGSNVRSIDIYAFSFCDQLTELEMPDHTISFGYDAFYGCDALKAQYDAFRPELMLDVPLATGIEIPHFYIQYYTFTPGRDCYYEFSSQGECDTVGYIYDSDMNLLAENHDGGTNTNFSVGYTMTAGTTYILGAALGGPAGYFAKTENGKFTVTVTEGHLYTAYVILEPGCSRDGIREYRCNFCDRSYTERIPGGHRYVSGSCTVCGAAESYTILTQKALSSESGLKPASGTNKDKQFYGSYAANPIISSLTVTEKGYLRVEKTGSKIIAEEYTKTFQLISRKEIALELSLYGGVHVGRDYNFIVCGQENHQEDDSREVVRIIRYDKNWNRIDSASLCGANTTIPFRAATVRFAEAEDVLYIRTGHQMYTASDGLNHQAVLHMGLQISKMELFDVGCLVSFSTFGYTSHSFNQFVLVDGTTLIGVDHGDAYPRGIQLIAAQDRVGKAASTGDVQQEVIMSFTECREMYQQTGVSVGAVQYSDSHYLTVGCGVDQSAESISHYDQRNIFVIANRKDDVNGNIENLTWLTHFQQGHDVKLSPPHLTKIDDNRFFMTWTENGSLRYCFLDGTGTLVSEIFNGSGMLSDCVPIVDGNRIVWYVTNSSVPTFYSIELYHIHRFEDGICVECGAEESPVVAKGWSGYTQWTLRENGVLTVYGQGNMKNYGYDGGQPWLSYRDQITAVEVKEGVDAIGTGAFMNLPNLETVTLPESGLTKIGEAAFYGCASLKEIVIPKGVYTIWRYTFKNCTGLESVSLPKTLIKIDQGAFENCTALESVSIPEDVNIIGSWSFKGCTGLVEADMSLTEATEIREGAFKNCAALTTVHFPAGIRKLGDSAFYGIGAVSFTIPETVAQVGPWCFARAYSLENLYFAGDAPVIGEGAFNKITLTAHYPAGNATWTPAIMQNYGGTVTWRAD